MRTVFAFFLAAAGLFAFGDQTSLVDAVQQRQFAEARMLLEQGAQVNADQVDGMTALHWAAYYNNEEMVEALLQAGADPGAQNRYGVTALSLACQNGNGTMVETLLDAGADPNTTLPGGETALMTASRTGKIEPVRALLDRGADVDRTEQDHGQSALMWAAAEGHDEVVSALITAGADVNLHLGTGFTPFLFAVRNGRIGSAKLLLAAGADVNEPAKVEEQVHQGLRNGSTPLLVATANANYEMGVMLLDAGADPNAAQTGFTPLHLITEVRKPGVGDNDPAPQGLGKMTSLEFVEKLVEHGADINARMTKDVNLGNTRLNHLGATPFLLAATSADAELLRKLAELGADTTLTNVEHSTPLMVAAGIATRSPGEDAGTESEVVEAMQALLDMGANINAVDDNGETAMHGAAYKNLPGAIEFLDEHGADINVWNQKNKWGWSPLTIAEGYRFGNFKPSPPTIDALKMVMLKHGVEPVSEKAVQQEIYQ